MPCKGCHGKAKHGGECEGCGERWQVSYFIYSLFILMVYSHVCEPDDLSSQNTGLCRFLVLNMTGLCQPVGAPPASRIERLSRRTWGGLSYVILVGGCFSARRYALDETDSF